MQLPSGAARNSFDAAAQSLHNLTMKVSPRRRDGFAGQCLLVVPDPVRRTLSRHPLLAGLMVTDAGFYPRAPGHLVDRPGGASTHLLMACLRGRGWVEADGRRLPLARGDIASLPAYQPHRYGANDDTPWSLAWVHFAGTESDAWLESATGRSATTTTCHVPPERLESLGFDRVHAVLENGYGVRELVEAAALLRVTLSTLSRLRVQSAGSVSAQERVAAAISRVRANWSVPHRVSELAASAGLSVTHFMALFRRQTGFPPIDFLLRLRVQQGAQLLATTTRTVSEIALQSGFDDPYYFTRCFRRIMGCSPRAYRTAGGRARST